MAKKNEQAAEQTAEEAKPNDRSADEPRYVTAPATRTLDVKKPTPHQVLVTSGTRLKVVPDGSKGRPVDDVRGTVWESYADQVEAPDEAPGAATETE